MSVVDEPIEDSVGDGRVADQFVPVIDGKLASHDGRGASMPIVEDFEKVAPLVERERGQAPVVQDQELDARQHLEQAAVASITACEQQGIEQALHAVVKDRAVVAAGMWPSAQATKLLPTPACPMISAF